MTPPRRNEGQGMGATTSRTTLEEPAVEIHGRRKPTIVAGRYEVDLDVPLGSGGMALVYKGRDLRTRRPVALKTLRLEYRSDPETRARFRHEARLMAFVAHPNVARVFDLHEDVDAPWAVQEYIAGRTLRDLIEERDAFPPGEVTDLLDQIAAALGHLHERGLVHLDVKPQNLIVTPEGVVKLIDFGLAQTAGARQELIGGTTFGTAAYLAPEQASGEAVDAATDVYALGCVVYELLTGRPPFQSDGRGEVKNDLIRAHMEQRPTAPSKVRPDLDLPDGLDDVILWALAKEPAQRYRDAESFARLFRAATQQVGLSSAVTTAPLALIDVPHAEPAAPSARVVGPASSSPPTRGSAPVRRMATGAYRLGGKAARKSGWLRRRLWRLTVVVALGNVMLALVLVLLRGPTSLLPGEPVLAAGAEAQVVLQDLQLRSGPGLDAQPVWLLDDGDRLTLSGEAETADGMTWWPVETDQGDIGMTGYVWDGGISPVAGKRPEWIADWIDRGWGHLEALRDRVGV